MPTVFAGSFTFFKFYRKLSEECDTMEKRKDGREAGTETWKRKSG